MIEQIESLIEWSQMQHHDLPWRSSRSLYGTLVSEIMLQQTTVGTVRNHFSRFMNKFPTIHKLAHADEKEVLKEWRGLGYYRRAKNLHKAAKEISRKHQGNIPDNYNKLIKIPGVGDYTANALIAIGHNKRSLAIDANIERVVSRLFAIDNFKGFKNQKKIQGMFLRKKILNFDVSFRALNEAFMDLGRNYCQARKASCELCPLSDICEARKLGKPLAFPKDTESKENRLKDLKLLRVLVKKENKVLLFKRPKKKWLEDQYELPTFIVGEDDLAQYPQIKKFRNLEALPQYKTNITNYKIKNYILETEDESTINCVKEFKYVSLANLSDENVSSATIKALCALGLC